jgi:hypothetical protein
MNKLNSFIYTSPTSHKTGLEIAKIARQRAFLHGELYAFNKSPKSPNPEITGNKHPEKTPIPWLKNRNKCNQFIGDVLTLSGYKMPTFIMPDKSKHYANAEALLKFESYFFKIPSFDVARAGDLVIFDRPSVGENGAHVEMITELNAKTGVLKLTGARKNGAEEKDYSQILNKTLKNLHILRAKISL